MIMRELASLPQIQLFASPYCNLECDYCTQKAFRTRALSNDFLCNEELLNTISNIPPTHFYMSGGEPLVHASISGFVSKNAVFGHKFSFDTNGVVSSKKLYQWLTKWDRDSLGFFNISHHYRAGVSIDHIIQTCEILKSFKIRHFVKYIAIPDDFSKIAGYMDQLRERNIGVAITIFQGQWNGRVYPADYTLKESKQFLDLVTLGAHAIQLFGGIRSLGRSCRGGGDFITWNQRGIRDIGRCCHDSSKTLRIKDTFFSSGRKFKKACTVNICSGDLMFIFGINDMLDETDRLEGICQGISPRLGITYLLDILDKIHIGGQIVNWHKLDELTGKIHE